MRNRPSIKVGELYKTRGGSYVYVFCKDSDEDLPIATVMLNRGVTALVARTAGMDGGDFIYWYTLRGRYNLRGRYSTSLPMEEDIVGHVEDPQLRSRAAALLGLSEEGSLVMKAFVTESGTVVIVGFDTVEPLDTYPVAVAHFNNRTFAQLEWHMLNGKYDNYHYRLHEGPFDLLHEEPDETIGPRLMAALALEHSYVFDVVRDIISARTRRRRMYEQDTQY